jgi:ABC-type molybdate transport system substrate-binding protein
MGSKRFRPPIDMVAILLASLIKLAAAEINVFAAASLTEALKERR